MQKAHIQGTVAPLRQAPGTTGAFPPLHPLPRITSRQWLLTEQPPLQDAWPGKRGDPHAGQPATRGGSGKLWRAWYAVGRVTTACVTAVITDSVLGFRSTTPAADRRVVGERRPPAQRGHTRIMFQLELLGLSRLGAEPAKVLKTISLATACCAKSAAKRPPPSVRE